MEAMCHEPPYYRSETIITSHAVHTWVYFTEK
jgi:hypothetical protein